MMSVESHYKGEQGRQYHDVRHGNDPAVIWYVSKVRAQKLQPFVKETDELLEYGIGTGWNLFDLQCAKKFGYDLDNYITGQGKDITFLDDVSGRQFDVVLCHHALEHALEPTRELAKIHEALRPGGKLLLYVPYELSNDYLEYDPNLIHRHLYSWNPQSLGMLVDSCGFKVQQAVARPFGYERYAAKFAAKFGLPFAAYKLLLFAIRAARPVKEVFVMASKQ